MKTKPRKHQSEGRPRLRKNPIFYGLGCEQGTGKTWMILDDAEHQFNRDFIEALLIIAPKGVHTNWILREIPKHMDLEIDSEYWQSGAGKRKTKKMNKLLEDRQDGWISMRVFAMNIDAINTDKGFKFALKFLAANESMIVVDESSRIKSPTAGRTKRAIKLGTMAVSRRIASGTMLTNSPMDLFPQFEFLSYKGSLLGTTSYRAFTAEFAEVETSASGIMRHIAMRQLGSRWFGQLQAQFRILDDDDLDFGLWLQQQTHGKFKPPILIKKDSKGRPIYKNLDKLRKMIAPYIYRVLKKDCLDLPPQIFKTLTFDMNGAQRKVYDEIETNLRYLRDSGELDTFTCLTKIVKVRQIVSGFIMVDGEPEGILPAKDNPRMKLLREVLEDQTGQFIIWAMFKEELKQIAALLKEMDFTFGEYHGSIKDKAREAAVDGLQDGSIACFLGQPQSGGIGLTLTAATTMINYSHDYNLETRLQALARNHRDGTMEAVRAAGLESVLVIDIAASNSIDERMALALQAKSELAATVMDGLDSVTEDALFIEALA